MLLPEKLVQFKRLKIRLSNIINTITACPRRLIFLFFSQNRLIFLRKRKNCSVLLAQ